MTSFTKENTLQSIHAPESFTEQQIEHITHHLNTISSYTSFTHQVKQKHAALKNEKATQDLIRANKPNFPVVIESTDVAISPAPLQDCAIVITAGGEGERLRTSLNELGYTDAELENFTKATFPIPNTDYNYGALEINLRGIKALCETSERDIPVVITTGPKGSTTASYIPRVLEENNSFGLKNTKVIEQLERFHLTNDDKIAIVDWVDDLPIFATNPDETGGPIAKLSDPKDNTLEWLESLGIKTLIILQGTAIYEPSVIPTIASTAENFDVLGVGISRETFPADDPYGTFAIIDGNAGKRLMIIEKNVRSKEVEKLFSNELNAFLPFNTGFYAIKLNTLKTHKLPDYASPNKIIKEGIAPSPKCGFAATHILEFSDKSGVLTLPEESFKVIKNAQDLIQLAETVHTFNL